MFAKRLLFCLSLAVCALAVAASGAAAAPRDRNHDRIPDRWEKRNHLSLHVNQARRDQDHDGLRNLGEFRSHTDPRDADTDNDGIDDEADDTDHDGVDNGNEIREHTDPSDRDTDNDGVSDGREDADHDALRNVAEDRTGNDPVDRDTDNDGVGDGQENAGRVASFENGVLTITLAGGGSVNGLVTDATQVSCNSENEDEDRFEASDGPHGAQAASDEEGDGDQGDGDQGDDDQGENEDDGGDNACTQADLAPGTFVHEANLSLAAAGLIFEEIDLVR